tara:strand:- start:16956 stop:17213 length:258 start_codon:yes stop_codon:yes gene_type:complete
MKNLEYIKLHVKTWPVGATDVRVDPDGEICFYPMPCWDFYPPGEQFDGNAQHFNRHDWERYKTKNRTRIVIVREIFKLLKELFYE